MRSAKEAGVFPYKSSLVCYFEVDKKGNVYQLSHSAKSDKEKLYKAYKRALAEKTVIYAVWPGEWRSDLFIIDDLDAFSAAFKLI